MICAKWEAPRHVVRCVNECLGVVCVVIIFFALLPVFFWFIQCCGASGGEAGKRPGAVVVVWLDGKKISVMPV